MRSRVGQLRFLESAWVLIAPQIDGMRGLDSLSAKQNGNSRPFWFLSRFGFLFNSLI